MADARKPIAPNPTRWKPSNDPSSINVPGLDRDASVTDQIEQIEQLITIKLQNIDENFAKIHNVLASQILPAVKRYSIGTEPVREAAKFWTSFYERAAQIRIPTYDEHSTVNEIPSDTEEVSNEEEQEQTVQIDNTRDGPHDFEPSMAQTESSFMPGQDAFSSTPATTRGATTMDSFASHGSNEPSWANSMESPLLRLKSEIQNFSTDDDSIITATGSGSSSILQQTPAPDRQDSTILPPSTTKSTGKSKGKEPELLRNVLRHNLYNQSSDEFTMKGVSPLKPKAKPKTPVPKEYNPYLSPGTDSSNWTGVVDLRDPSVLSPKKYHHSSKASSSRVPKTPTHDSDDDDSFDGLPQGMSPPVLMSPARPPRTLAELGLQKLGQSPSKQAAARIVKDIVRDVQANSGYKPSRSYYGITDSHVESSMSTVQTPPSLSKYHRGETSESLAEDASLDSMIRRVGLDVPSRAGLNSTPGLRLRGSRQQQAPARTYSDSSAEDSFPAISATDQLFAPNYMGDYQGNDNLSSDSDSLDMDDEVNNTAHPSAAFLMASQGRPGADDSFGSSNHSSDSLDEDVGGLAPIHPFGGTVEDDGFDDDDDSYDTQQSELQEETVFGVPPAQRLRQEALRQQEGLRMHGGDLLDDTIGVQIVAGDLGVDESPTPAAWNGGSDLRG
ncbi:hypothetical protein DFP72DRAFT_813293 [Ephemerocybe angulata]|uniref:DASH complex subunit ASK1 n=1 Tax=Ephemerocybe angulata TaxID=980116 RepID=A0A8H6HVV5_9AGAR|nr:hypothetical protein DFP72DRAFT_813293 [Tulosesus angulatus]